MMMWQAARRAAFSIAAGLLVGAAALAQSHATQAPRSVVRWSDVQLIDGRTLRAEELNRKTVVVQLWASWCPFCNAQNPHVQKLHDAMRDKNLVVLAFSIDRNEQAARDYVAKRGYTFNVAMNTPEVERWFGKRRTLPETYVVDPNGRIVFEQRGEMFEEDIAALARFAAR